jgi:zinc protease
MKKASSLFPRTALVAGFLLLAAALRGAIPFPQEGSDLKPDPAARFGTLPNGLRYVIYPNHEPKGRASLRLLVEAGSLNETEAQRGLAHFLEHMAFNGSAHYAPGTLVEFFQRMGMSFGGDTNASTGFERTLYLLELPDTKEGTLAEGLQVFADYAGGLLLAPPQIDKERGIILSEKRTRDSVEYRTFVAGYSFLLGGTLFPQRLPIGLSEIIEQAGRDRFADFYNTWYRPELMSVVIVGDIDPAAIEKQLTTALAGVTDRAPARPAPDRGKIAPPAGVHVLYQPEPEAPDTTVSISTLAPFTREPDTAAYRLKDLPRDLATEIVNRRLSILAKKENAPFIGGSTVVREPYNFYRQASIALTCKADQWAAALAVGEQELRRALQHGFQPAELQEIVANYANDMEQAVKTASTRRSPALADEIAQNLLERDVFTTPADDLALFKPALEKVTVADCVAALRAAWAADHRYVIVTGNMKIDGDASAAITAAYTKSLSVAVPPPAAAADDTWAYTKFGTAGQIVKRDHIADLDIDLVTFANGVRLNLKKTDFEAGVIRLNARIGNGTMTEPAGERGLAGLTGATVDAGGLGRHSVDDLRRILAGKTVSVGFRPETDAFDFVGGTTRDDLLLELQLLAAKITDSGFRPEALRQARKSIGQLYLSFAHTANGPMATEVSNLLASGDPRFGLPAQEVMLARNLDEIRAWLAPQLAHGAIELSLVGDLDPDATIAAVAQTLGALPPREPKPALANLRKVAFPAQPFVRDYTIASEIPKGLVAVFWPTTDGNEIKRTRRLTLLASVLGDRLRVKIREELGGTYSPQARSFASEPFPGYGYFTAAVDVEPAKAAKIADTVIALADDLAQHGVTDDELTRAKQPMLTAVKESLRKNPYWLGNVLARAQEKPEVLDWSRTLLSDVEAITAADLSALAKTYLGRDRASRVIVLPAAAPAAPSAPTAAPSAPATVPSVPPAAKL